MQSKKARKATTLCVPKEKWCRQRESNPYGFKAEGF